MPGIPLAEYLKALAKLRQQAEATPELSLREPLLVLLRSMATKAGRPGILIAPEADAGQAGQPDIFLKDGPRLVGFVETKAPGEDLGRWLNRTAQAKRYRESLPNWFVTDYYRFIFVRDGKPFRHLQVADPHDAATLVANDDAAVLYQKKTRPSVSRQSETSDQKDSKRSRGTCESQKAKKTTS